MIKGWRNDPQWVAFYAKRDRERIEREIERLKIETEIAMRNVEADVARRQLRRPSPFTASGVNW